MSTDEKLRAAGYKRTNLLRMVRASSEITDADLILWIDEDGKTLTERQAIEGLEEREKEDS